MPLVPLLPLLPLPPLLLLLLLLLPLLLLLVLLVLTSSLPPRLAAALRGPQSNPPTFRPMLLTEVEEESKQARTILLLLLLRRGRSPACPSVPVRLACLCVCPCLCALACALLSAPADWRRASRRGRRSGVRRTRGFSSLTVLRSCIRCRNSRLQSKRMRMSSRWRI